MSTYFVVDIRILDLEMYEKYIGSVRKIVESYGGKYLAITDKVTSFAPDWQPDRVVICEFPDEETIHKCFSSEEYSKIVWMREKGIVSRAIIVEGLK